MQWECIIAANVIDSGAEVVQRKGYIPTLINSLGDLGRQLKKSQINMNNDMHNKANIRMLQKMMAEEEATWDIPNDRKSYEDSGTRTL